MLQRKIVLLLVCFVLASGAAAAQPELVPLPVEGYGSQVVASPDGTIAVAFTDTRAAIVADMALPNDLTIISLSDNSVVTTLDGPVDIATSVAFTADGALLAVVHANGDIALWNTDDWSLLHTHTTLHVDAQTLGFLPDGTTLTLLTTGVQPLLLLVDATTGAFTGVAGRHYAHSSDLRAILREPQGIMRASAIAAALTPDGTRFASANGFDEIVVRDIETLDWFMARQSDSEVPLLSIARMAFADNRTLVYMLRSGELREYDLESRADRLIATVAERLWTIGVSRDGTLIAAVARDPDALIVVERATGATILQMPLTSPQAVFSLHFMPDNSALLLGTLNPNGDGPSAAILPIAP